MGIISLGTTNLCWKTSSISTRYQSMSLCYWLS